MGRISDSGNSGAGVWDSGRKVVSRRGSLVLLVTYQLWSFMGQGRDDGHVRVCSAVVRVGGGGGGTSWGICMRVW